MDSADDIEGGRRRRDVAEVVAREAAALLMSFKGHASVSWKGVGDLVTAADQAAEAHVIRRLAEAFPDDRIIGEEGGGHGGDADWVWYVDPLDGTTNFVCGLPHFAVSLGAFFCGRPAVGVVVAPELGRAFVGARGLGATCNGVPIHVAAEPQLTRVLAATGFPYDRSTTSQSLVLPLERALVRCLDVRRLGSAALDLCLVADGTFGVYWEPRLKPWDFAAGVLLVEEAGGQVSDHHGGDGYLTSCGVLASNGHVHAQFLRDVLA